MRGMVHGLVPGPLLHPSGRGCVRRAVPMPGSALAGSGVRHLVPRVLAAGGRGGMAAVRVPFAPERLAPLLGLFKRRRAPAGDARLSVAAEQGGEHKPAGDHGCGRSLAAIHRRHLPAGPSEGAAPREIQTFRRESTGGPELQRDWEER
jgi:hypothetical protein